MVSFNNQVRFSKLYRCLLSFKSSSKSILVVACFAWAYASGRTTGSVQVRFAQIQIQTYCRGSQEQGGGDLTRGGGNKSTSWVVTNRLWLTKHETELDVRCCYFLPKGEESHTKREKSNQVIYSGSSIEIYLFCSLGQWLQHSLHSETLEVVGLRKSCRVLFYFLPYLISSEPLIQRCNTTNFSIKICLAMQLEAKQA